MLSLLYDYKNGLLCLYSMFLIRKNASAHLKFHFDYRYY